MQAKLNPQRGDVDAKGKISYPGFQEILDFTSAGSESSASITVDGDTDKEYIICIRNSGGNEVHMRLNSDSGTNYGQQYLLNYQGTITAASQATTTIQLCSNPLGISETKLCTPSGFIKTAFTMGASFNSGTTIDYWRGYGFSWNNTANVTLINLYSSSGNFTSGTRIVVYARRSN